MTLSPAARVVAALAAALSCGVVALLAAPGPGALGATRQPAARAAGYPWHTHVVSTTFWVGEVFDASAPDGSQVISTYDEHWERHYGGCDGRVVRGTCRTERRRGGNGWFPRHMTPHQNPFYLDVPYDDVNDTTGFRRRGQVEPWAHERGYRGHVHDRGVSLIKNRWVEIRAYGHTCYGQVEDAGPGDYHDARYVFGHHDARPANHRYGGAGMDVSPALNGCLHFRALDGDHDHVAWRFVDGGDVPPGPWRRIVTRSGVS